MSWAQRRGPSRPSTTTTNPPVQVYNPNQHSNTEWQSPLTTQTWHQPQQQQQPTRQDVNQRQPYWQQSPQSYVSPNQTPNANSVTQFQQYQQQPQLQDQGAYLQNSGTVYNPQQPYGNVQYSQQFDQNNIYSGQQTSSQPTNEGDAWGNWGWGDDDNSNAPLVTQQPQAPTNQAIGDSFANDESWNWSVMEQQQQNADENNRQDQPTNNLFPTIGDLKSKSDRHVESVNTRKKLETPQWSTESQPSLESSDDVLHTSESDKSHMVSRSSTISHSPISGQESLPSTQGVVHQAELRTNHPVENKEIVKQEIPETRPPRVNPTPPLPKPLHTPPLLPPPQGGSDDSRNPYKRSTGLSHKSANKYKPGIASSVESRQSLQPVNFPQSVNLETLPDNSEHPDHPLIQSNVKTSAASHQQWPQIENNEAPINDRNQYLETGQLSEVNLTEGNEGADLGNDTLPPPGLQRMVPGQLEQNEIGVGRTDQPIPGFSRMVLGQHENRPNISNQNPPQFDLSGPPEGLHRMVPGESSSPETSLHQQNIEENDSELELNQLSQNHGVQPPRSATIGADTPPIQNQPPLIQTPSANLPPNRSETIGSDLTMSSGVDIPETSLSMVSTEIKINKNSKSKDKIEQQENRREAIEGQTNEVSVSSLTNAVRNLTVGENLTDGHTSNNSLPEQSPRRHSRQESSDSESDRKNSRSHRDKRSAEKSKPREKDRERERYKDRETERDRYRERNSDRYSPDPYRDKREGRSRRYRDRRYEEDTDYYSDKDRRRDDRDRDYERKYNSLRKEKDKRRKERDPRDSRDYRDSRRNDYYYNRYGDEYGAENRSSRPSSRSDSMHESYRERRHEADSRDRRPRDRDRDRERDRYRNRDHRDAYNPYQSFAYDPYNPYYQQYQYYENLRRTNPQAYAEWYRKYYQQATGSTASFTGEDRASVHSGRSSANDELAKDRYTRQSFYSQSNYYGQSHSISGHYGHDSSSIGYNRNLDQTDNSLIYEQQPSAAQRLTPNKYATAHMKASIASGKLIRILPNYPMDGQNAIVDVCDLQAFLENSSDHIELSSFPGPLIKGVTHKKQIIEYCDNKIKDATCNRDIVDVESYILMWELLILLIRQNGMVVGTDIAELLLKNRNLEPAPRPPSVLSTTSSNVGDRNEVSETSIQQISEHGSTQSIVKEEEVTRKFREYLLYGSCQEALEWAMKHGLWGHALFLASKLDKRTYANIMMRFANGLTMNDPLQTLYQLLSGKMPAVVTCVADEKWGDWRPHLAMILSNSTQRPELNCKAITQLGDTLLNRGSLYAAQFCYLMAEVGFGAHAGQSTRLVLLGSDHRKPFPQFITNEAIHMTEIYEYACSLNDQGFHIAEFQFYKYILATRLADFGLLERALQYLELLAGRIISNPAEMSPALVDNVCELSDRLKFYDPVGDAEDISEFGAVLETSRPDNSWLKDLRAIQNDYKSGKISQAHAIYQDLQTTAISDNTLQQSTYDESQDIWQQEQQQYDRQQQLQFDRQYQEGTIWSTDSQSQPDYGFQSQDGQQQITPMNQYQDQQNYWTGQQMQPWGDQSAQYSQETNLSNADQLHTQEDASTGFYDNSNNQLEEPSLSQPQISMPNQPKGKSAYDDEPLPHEKQENKANSPKVKPQPAQQEINQSTGWFGGIFSKLSMRPKNPMKLPDDKNPKIVWDETKKRWINLDEDPNDPANEFKPPPKMADLMPKMAASQPPQVPGMGVSMNNSSLDYSSANFNNNAAVNNVPFNVDQSGSMSLPAMGAAVTQKEEVLPPRSGQSNMFKMQKNRNVKNAYVDVFKQNGVKTNTEGIPAPEQVPMVAPTQMNFFIPQPVANSNAPVDFLTPGGAPVNIGDPQISRWSSTSSLSREVAYYMHDSGRG